MLKAVLNCLLAIIYKSIPKCSLQYDSQHILRRVNLHICFPHLQRHKVPLPLLWRGRWTLPVSWREALNQSHGACKNWKRGEKELEKRINNKSPQKMWIRENRRRINKSLPIIATKAITELGKIYNRLKSGILGTRHGKAVRREFCMLAPSSRAASDAASAVLSHTEQAVHFGCLSSYLSASNS